MNTSESPLVKIQDVHRSFGTKTVTFIRLNNKIKKVKKGLNDKGMQKCVPFFYFGDVIF